MYEKLKGVTGYVWEVKGSDRLCMGDGETERLKDIESRTRKEMIQRDRDKETEIKR